MNPSSPDVTPHDPAAPLVDVNRTGGEPAEGIGENGGWTRSTRLAESLLSAGAGYHDREYLLARCGCALRFSHLFRPEHLALVRHAERIADGDVPPSPPAAGETDLLTELVNDLPDVHRRGDDYLFRLLSLVGGRDREGGRAAEVAAQEDVVRDVFGDPHRPDEFDARWLTADVVGLARHIYTSGDFSALPVLADALMDGGCVDAAVLDHCRSDGPHVRGCWAVELVLGRSVPAVAGRLRLVGLADGFESREWTFSDPFEVGRRGGRFLADAPGDSLSRLHATVFHDAAGWWVADRGSTNGTWLNGTRLGEHPAGPLQIGDIVQFAEVAVRVVSAPPGDHTAADGAGPTVLPGGT